MPNRADKPPTKRAVAAARRDMKTSTLPMSKKLTQAPASEPRWLAKIRSASKKNGTDKLSMAEISRIVAIVRSQEQSSEPDRP